MCQTDPAFFALWEIGRGPAQHREQRHLPCRDLCNQIGEEICETCRGKVRIKVFACQVHGMCSLSENLAKLACCVTCPEYHPAADSPARTDTTHHDATT